MSEPHSYPPGCSITSLKDIAGKKVTIMGLGLNGGGEAATRFFLKHGAIVTVTDMKTREELSRTLRNLTPDMRMYGKRIQFVLGGHKEEDFSTADIVIKNPGVKIQGNRYLAAAKAIETDLSIFLALTKAPIIAVTGSKGKSSTVSAIHHGLKAAGFNAFLGGNITVSPLTFLEDTDETTPVVLELSSWQLADLRGRGLLKPKVSLITTIVPDHQNWYGSMEAYVADKKLIYADQAANQWTICGSDSWGDRFASEAGGRVLRYSAQPLPTGQIPDFKNGGCWLDSEGRGWVSLPTEQFPNFAQNAGKSCQPGQACQPQLVLDKLLVPGLHSRQNALNAALVMALIQVPPKRIREVLAQWSGIPHRLEYFHSWNIFMRETGRLLEYRFYNDSAATVPEAAAAAAAAFPSPVQLICGGTDKDLDFKELVERLKERPPANLHLLAGTATDKLIPLLVQAGIPYRGPYRGLDQLLMELKRYLEANAARFASQLGITAGTLQSDFIPVVFSPGATSFGMFQNEFHRGDSFRELVKNIF